MQKQNQLDLLEAYAKPKRRSFRKSKKSAQRKRVTKVEVKNVSPAVESPSDMNFTEHPEKDQSLETHESQEKLLEMLLPVGTQLMPGFIS